MFFYEISVSKIDSNGTSSTYQVGLRLLELAEKNLALAKAGRWGDIEVEVFFEEERGVDEPGGLGKDRFFGIGLSIPLPLHDQNQGAIAEQTAQCRRLHWKLKAIESSLKSQAAVERQIIEQIYRQALDYQNELTPTMEANLKAMNDAYAAGQIGLTDLFRTQEQNLRIQSAQLELLRELAESFSRWRAATTQSISFFSTDLSQ